MLSATAFRSELALQAGTRLESAGAAPLAQGILQTRYACIRIGPKGFITSLTSRQSGKEYSPEDHPSPLLSLHEDGQPNDKLLAPVSAEFRADKRVIDLKYPSGATAVVTAEGKDTYLHFFSLLPGFERSRPRHQVSDPVEGVDFMGSGVALYACPDDQGLAKIERILLTEGLPHIVIDGKWIRDPSAFGVTLNWSGPYDKCIEYAQALGVKDISRETGEFYPCLGNNWSSGNVGFSSRQPMSFKEFTEEAHKHGLSHGGLHTLTVFLQGGISHDVTPVPSEHLQTVLRTKLARDISPTDTNILVTDPSFLAENGTWPMGEDANYLRIGGEMLRYDGISAAAPFTLTGVRRGHASKAVGHTAGDELVKLQQNCYNGFVPDIKRLLDYSDYYADLMYRNGMDAIGFDGFESTVYQNHGYYAVRIFCRRLFETYAKLTGGKVPRMTASSSLCRMQARSRLTRNWRAASSSSAKGSKPIWRIRSGRRSPIWP